MARSSGDKAKVKLLGREACSRLLEAAEDVRLHALVVLALDSGMRLAEILALRWNDVDFLAGEVMCERTLLPGGVVREIPGRVIEVGDETIYALHDHKAKSPTWGRTDSPVFCDVSGRQQRPDTFRRREWKPLLDRAGLRGLRFGVLRDTYAFRAVNYGVDGQVVAERLGRTSHGAVLDRYFCVTEAMHREAAEVMGRILSGEWTSQE